jgi:excisionase family DNA binding protein
MSDRGRQAILIPAKRLVSLDDAADYWGVNPRTIRRRIADGTLTGYRTGPKLLRVDLNELDREARPVPTVRHGAA